MDIKWAKEASDGNYEGASSYLNLVMGSKAQVEQTIKKLRAAEITKFKAKDIFRASGLKPLATDNENVKKNIKKMKEEDDLTPVLLVRDEENKRVIVADGYHRSSAVYAQDEDEWIHCKIA